MKAAVRFVFCTLTVLLVAPIATAQFEKLQPSNYAVWSPVVGSGAVYQIKSGIQNSTLQVAVVKRQGSGRTPGYWLETQETEAGRRIFASKQLLDPGFSELREREAFDETLDAYGRPKVTHRPEPAVITDVPRIPLDFRRRTVRFGEETISTANGDLACEIWQTKDGLVKVWYSPQVTPFGIVRIESREGTVQLLRVIARAKESIFVFPVDPSAARARLEYNALFEAFPGVWNPVEGTGAIYQIHKNDYFRDVQASVTRVQEGGAGPLFRLELEGPCSSSIGMPSRLYFSSSGKRKKPGHADLEHQAKADKCVNSLLVDPLGLVKDVQPALYLKSSGRLEESAFSLLDMMLLSEGIGEATHLADEEMKMLEMRPSEDTPPAPPDYSWADFRKRAVLLGVEDVVTPAGTFPCEHWLSTVDTIQVWLNPQVAPFGIVKKTNVYGTMVLKRLINGATAQAQPAKLPRSGANYFSLFLYQER